MSHHQFARCLFLKFHFHGTAPCIHLLCLVESCVAISATTMTVISPILISSPTIVFSAAHPVTRTTTPASTLIPGSFSRPPSASVRTRGPFMVCVAVLRTRPSTHASSFIQLGIRPGSALAAYKAIMLPLSTSVAHRERVSKVVPAVDRITSRVMHGHWMLSVLSLIRKPTTEHKFPVRFETKADHVLLNHIPVCCGACLCTHFSPVRSTVMLVCMLCSCITR